MNTERGKMTSRIYRKVQYGMNFRRFNENIIHNYLAKMFLKIKQTKSTQWKKPEKIETTITEVANEAVGKEAKRKINVNKQKKNKLWSTQEIKNFALEKRKHN